MKTIDLQIPVFGSDHIVTRRVDNTPEALATGGYHAGDWVHTSDHLYPVVLERYLGNGQWMFRSEIGEYGSTSTPAIKGLSVKPERSP